MARAGKARSFWSSAPGILTGIAGVLTAIAALVAAFDSLSSRDEKTAVADPQPSTTLSTSGDQSPIVSDTEGNVTIIEGSN